MTNHLQFQISAGELSSFDTTGTQSIIGPAYAGAPGFVNDPTTTSIPKKGALPQGWYEIGSPVDDPVTGLYTLPLTPLAAGNAYGLPATETFDRSEFKIHGPNAAKDIDGAQESSEGCIVAVHPERVVAATFTLIEVVS